MDRTAEEGRAVERARWLAELADAVDQAQSLAWALGVAEGNNPEAVELFGRLDCVRVEVELMRSGRWSEFRTRHQSERAANPDSWPELT